MVVGFKVFGSPGINFISSRVSFPFSVLALIMIFDLCSPISFIDIYCSIDAYHHWCFGFDYRSEQGVQHYMIKFVSDLRWFSPVTRFPPPIKRRIQHNWNIVESGVKHHKTKNNIMGQYWPQWNICTKILENNIFTSLVEEEFNS